MRRCSKCKQSLALDQFSPGSHRCKPCHRGLERARRAPIMGAIRDKQRATRAAQPERHIRALMIQRCHDENSRDYPKYGARGIQVCQRWRDSFEAFLKTRLQRGWDLTRALMTPVLSAGGPR